MSKVPYRDLLAAAMDARMKEYGHDMEIAHAHSEQYMDALQWPEWRLKVWRDVMGPDKPLASVYRPNPYAEGLIIYRLYVTWFDGACLLYAMDEKAAFYWNGLRIGYLTEELKDAMLATLNSEREEGTPL